jgi:hypothetical protein
MPREKLVLAYQRAVLRAPVTVRKFFDVMEAQLFANELAAHAIKHSLLNQNALNMLGWYSGFGQIELQVHEEDAVEADAILSRLNVNSDEVEPVDDGDPQAPIADSDGGGVLVAAGAYDQPRKLYDAAATLGAANIESFLPVLALRGTRPPGVGNRFVIRVREADVAEARELLERQLRDHEDEPRCPQCGSWQTYLLPPPWRGLWNYLFSRTPKVSGELECLRCHHRWEDPRQQ